MAVAEIWAVNSEGLRCRGRFRNENADQTQETLVKVQPTVGMGYVSKQPKEGSRASKSFLTRAAGR